MTKSHWRISFLGLLSYFVSSILAELFFPNSTGLATLIFLFAFLISFIIGYHFYTEKVLTSQAKKLQQNEVDERFYQIRNLASWYTLLGLFVSGGIVVVVFQNVFSEEVLQAFRMVILFGIGLYFVIFSVVRKRM